MAIKKISDLVEAVVVDEREEQLEQEIQALKQQLADKQQLAEKPE